MNFENALASMLMGKKVKRAHPEYNYDWIACDEKADMFWTYHLFSNVPKQEIYEKSALLFPSDLLAQDWEVVE